jgi:anti-sigma B factor antagonist
MQVNHKNLENVAVVELVGEIDGKTAPQAQEAILPLLQPGAQILLDMTGVPYMSSAGLRMLLSTYRTANTNSARVVLVGLSEEIADTMSATGFLNYFTAVETLDEGLAALKQ